jgi:hypothetical protein
MPLTGEAKREYNRQHWQRRRSEADQTTQLAGDNQTPQAPQTVMGAVKDRVKMNPDRTVRRTMAAHAILEGKSTSAALRMAGLNPKTDTARRAAEAIAQRALHRAGATPARVAQAHVALLDAREVVTVKRPDESGALVVAEERSQDDNASRRWAVEHIYKVNGAYPRDKEDPTVSAGPIVAINFHTAASPTDITPRITTALTFPTAQQQEE